MSAVLGAAVARESARRFAFGARALTLARRGEIHVAGKFSSRAASSAAGEGDSPTTWGTYVSTAYKQAGFNKEASVSFYEQSAHFYDKLATPSLWLAPLKVASFARELTSQSGVPPKSGLVLDFGAGTGQLGVSLRMQGFELIDAVEPSTKMLELAPNDTYCRTFSDEKEAADEGYDVVVSTGVIGTHVDASGLRSLLAKVNVGGHMIFSCKACSWKDDGFLEMAADISGSGAWRHGVLFGPAPLNKDMPDQKHVIVYMTKMA